MVPTFDDPIELSILTNPPGNGVLNGTNPLGALYGTAAYDDLTIDQSGKGYVLQATDYYTGTSVAAGATSTFDVTPGPAAQLVFASTGEPVTTAIAGQNFAAGSPVIVDAEDKFGSVDPTYNGPVTIVLANNATGVLVGTLTVNAVNGVATFSNLAIDTVGTYMLEATSGTLTDAISTSITITPAAPAQLVWATEPPAQVTETFALGAVLDVLDQYGNLETGYTQNVSVALDLNGAPANSDLSGTTTVAASGGVATFSNIIINTIGDPFTLIATSSALTSVSSSAIDVVAPQLVVTAQPTTAVTAGAGFPLTVSVETYLGAVDTAYNGTVTLSINSGPAGSTIGGTTSAAVSSGVATFDNVILDTAGSYVLQASSGNLIPGDTNTITVVASSIAAGLYIVDQPPSSVEAGAGFGLEVGAVDQFGNPTALTGNVSLAILNNPGNSPLGGQTSVTASGGVANFSGLTLNIVGDGYTLQASDGSLATATTSGIDVTPAPATQLVIPASGEPPASVAAGQAFSMVVDADDPFGNLDNSYTGSATISLPSNVTGNTTVSISNGVATFSDLVINTAGSYKLDAASAGLTSATSTSVTVTSATTPTQLVWAAEPPSQVPHGVGFGATIDVEDQFGNVDTAFNGSVTIALDNNPGDGTLGGTTTLNASGGVAAFSGLTISSVANNDTLVATSDGLTSPASSSIDVTLIPPVGIKVSTQPPASVQVAQTFGLTVAIIDQAGNPDPDFSGSVTVAISGPPGTNTLAGTTIVTASGGVANFSGLTLADLGTVTLQVSSSGLGSITTSTINVTAASAAKLVLISNPPANLTAGATFGFEVEAEDQFGNVATSFNGSLTAVLSPNAKNATLGGGVSTVASDGVAFFAGLTVLEAGNGYTIQVTSGGLTPATTSALNVTPAAASQLMISNQAPASVAAGDPFGITVEVTDPYGNVVPSYNGPVTIGLSSNPVNGILGGPLTLAATFGTASFSNLTILAAASGYAIEATSGNLTAATSNAIDVTPAAPTKLEVLVQPPSNMEAGADFGLGIVAEDEYGNRATQFTGDVSIALSADPGGAALSGGPLTVAAVAGVADFLADFTTFDTALSGYTIQATSAGLAAVTTGVIAVSAAPATHLVVVTAPPSFLAPGGNFGFVVAAEDPFGNINSSFSGKVAVAAPAGSGITLGGSTTVTAKNGLATFSGLALGQFNSSTSLVVTSAGLAGTTTAVNESTPAELAFALSSVSVDENAGDATIQVVRSGANQGAVSVQVTTAGGTAVAGVNYTAISQTLNFAAGQDSQSVTIPVKNVGVLSSPLTVNIVLNNPGEGAVLGSLSTATLAIQNVGQSTGTPPPGSLVTLESAQEVIQKRFVTEIVLSFSGSLNAKQAASTAEYKLIEAGKKGSFTAKNARVLKLQSATYNPMNNTVTLKPKARFAQSALVELIVNGLPPSGLEDSSGRLIDGNDDGQSGGNAVVVLKPGGATPAASRIDAAAADLLLARGDLAIAAKARKK